MALPRWENEGQEQKSKLIKLSKCHKHSLEKWNGRSLAERLVKGLVILLKSSIKWRQKSASYIYILKVGYISCMNDIWHADVA